MIKREENAVYSQIATHGGCWFGAPPPAVLHHPHSTVISDVVLNVPLQVAPMPQLIVVSSGFNMARVGRSVVASLRPEGSSLLMRMLN